MLSRRPAACREAAYELKWDGFRGVRGGPRTRSSSGPAEESISAGDFPTSSRPRQLQVPVGTVLDGELCVWLEGRLDWGQLQRRLGSARQIAEQARTPPASYVTFDLLSVDGFDVRTRPWTARRSLRAIRRRPAAAAAGDAGDLRPGRGEHWSRDYRPMGIEGLVIKGAATRYVPGRDSSWLKWKTRETEEVILGAVTGTFDRPEAVIAGRLTTDGQLVLVGRSTPLTAAQAEQLAAVPTPIDSSRRPWPEQIGSLVGGPPVLLRHVDPVLLAEVSADVALQQARWRHSVRFVPAPRPGSGRGSNSGRWRAMTAHQSLSYEIHDTALQLVQDESLQRLIDR
jgi:ATP-dependent DNA ligase